MFLVMVLFISNILSSTLAKTSGDMLGFYSEVDLGFGLNLYLLSQVLGFLLF